jgi:Sec-independent protein translocase protein TatA
MAISLTEIAIIAAVILIAIYILPGKLPKLARAFGEGEEGVREGVEAGGGFGEGQRARHRRHRKDP